MTEDLTAQQSATVGAGAGVETPAAPHLEAPGAPAADSPPPVEPGAESEEGQQEPTPTTEGAPSAPVATPTPAPELPAVDVEKLRKERDAETRRFDAEMGRLNLEYQGTADEGKRAEIARSMGRLEAEYKAAYMANFAQEHGVELTDPEVNREAPNQAAFEASVLRAANRRLGEQAKAAKAQLAKLQADLPATVAAEVQRQLTASGVNRMDAGAGAAGGRVTDWTTATPEQVAAMQQRIDAQRGR